MSQYSDSQFNFEDPNSSWKMTFDNIPDESTVLDIGCSSGNFAKELISQKKCIVDGVEINPNDAKIAAKSLRNVYVINIETDELPEESYDIIFMGDVIEHLAQPIPALKRLQKLLKKDGKIVFSIPNITHMLVRMMLLKGTIEYGKTGLLDETHLHFYNQTEVLRIFNSAGYEIANIDYVERDIPVETLRDELQQVGLVIGDEDIFRAHAQSTDAATYQFVGSAIKADKPIKVQKLVEKSPINVNDEYLKQVNSGYKNKIKELEKLVYELRTEIQAHDEVTASNSYLIGRTITTPIRLVKSTKVGVRKAYGYIRNVQNIKNLIQEKYGLQLVAKFSKPDISLVIRSIEHPTSSTFIRMLSPLSLIAKETNQKIELVDGDRPSIASTSKVVIVQRTALINMKAAKYIVDKVKQNNATLYVDTDDAFSELDHEHPQYELQRERVEALNFVIENAAEVWFSTKSLRSLYAPKKSRVVENTIDDRVWHGLREKRVRSPKKSDPLEILYMGTKTHDGDFNMVLPALNRLHKEYPGEFRLHVIGVASHEKYPWLVDYKPKNGLYPVFIEWLDQLGPFDIGISPLEDTAFNSNKSDIKCLDYLALGIRPVVSDVTAYQAPELDKLIVKVANDKWYEALERELKAREVLRKESVDRSQEGYRYIANKRGKHHVAKALKSALGIQ